MNSVPISLAVFICVFASSLLGVWLRSLLPGQHVDEESSDVIKLAVGLIATMAALLLGLLVASAKTSYDTQKNEVAAASAKVVVLDRLLLEYGPETRQCRELLRSTVVSALGRVWSVDRSSAADHAPVGSELLYLQIQQLSPGDPMKSALHVQMSNAALELVNTRWLMFAQAGSSISKPLLAVVVCWLIFVFAGFGLLAPRNLTVIATLLVCALSVSGAIFMMLEMDTPFRGVVRIPDTPVRAALEQIEH